MDLFNDLVNNYETIQRKLASRVNQYREKQSRFADRISLDLESLPENKWELQNNFANTLIMGADLLINARLHMAWGIWSKLVFSPLAPFLFYR